jgi:hypothetical protein
LEKLKFIKDTRQKKGAICYCGRQSLNSSPNPPIIGGGTSLEKAKLIKNSTSPVPAGSRVTFFASPKKVTKERTDWLSPGLCRGGTLRKTAVSIADLRPVFVCPG